SPAPTGMSVASCRISWASNSAPVSSIRLRVPRTCLRFSTACCSKPPLLRSMMKCSRLCSASSMVANSSSRTRLSEVAPVTMPSAPPAQRLDDASVGEVRFLLAHVSGHGDLEVGRLEHGCIPGRNILKAVINAVVAHVADHLLGSTYSQGRLFCNLRRQFQHRLHQGRLVWVGTIDQADGLCLLPVDVTAGIGQLSHETVANDAWQALQSADISGHSHVDFLDGKLCVERAVAHVTSRDQIDSASEAIALDGGNHRLAAIVHGIQGSLQLEDLTA